MCVTVLKSYGPSLTVNVTVYIQTASRERDRIVKSWPRHHCLQVIKIKPQFCQGIESASSPGLYSSDVLFFLKGPCSLGCWVRGGQYSLRVYGPPDRTLPRTVYSMTPVLADKLIKSFPVVAVQRIDTDIRLNCFEDRWN